MKTLRYLAELLRRHPSTTALQACCDGELPLPARARILRHAHACPRCAEEIRARRALAQALAASVPDPDEHELALLRARLLAAVDAASREVVEQDLGYLLGHSCLSEIGRPGRAVTPTLDRRLAAFLGVRAATQLKAAWSATR